MAFQFASSNLVLELGILLAVLMGWQFTLAMTIPTAWIEGHGRNESAPCSLSHQNSRLPGT
jgi:hypothetical protein